jgi:3-dehydroquinate synthase
LLRDRSFYGYIEAHTDAVVRGNPEVVARVVQRSAELHLEHICGNGDPFELGSARPLDFGHWAAHKLESLTSHRLRHGEAVAIGIALDLTYSAAMGYLDRVSLERILRLFEAIGFKLSDQAMLEREADGTYTLLRGLKEFREHLGGELHITLLRGIGDSFEVTQMDESRVTSAIETLARRASRLSTAKSSVAPAAALR